MSKYCGKFDLYDCFFMRDEPVEEQLKRVVIHQGYGENEVLLDIKTEAQLALYFPYICGIITRDNLWIGYTDYVRQRELEHIDFIVKEIKKEKALCKRKNIEYIPENVYKKRLSWVFDDNKDAYMEIIKRVGVGGRQQYADIRLRSLDWLRKIWFKDLVDKYGYDSKFARKWVYHIE